MRTSHLAMLWTLFQRYSETHSVMDDFTRTYQHATYEQWLLSFWILDLLACEQFWDAIKLHGNKMVVTKITFLSVFWVLVQWSPVCPPWLWPCEQEWPGGIHKMLDKLWTRTNTWECWKEKSYVCNARSPGQLPREKVPECLLQLECCSWLKAAVSTILDSQVFELCTQQAKPCTLKAREFSYGDHSPYLTFLETHWVHTHHTVFVSVWGV